MAIGQTTAFTRSENPRDATGQPSGAGEWQNRFLGRSPSETQGNRGHQRVTGAVGQSAHGTEVEDRDNRELQEALSTLGYDVPLDHVRSWPKKHGERDKKRVWRWIRGVNREGRRYGPILSRPAFLSVYDARIVRQGKPGRIELPPPQLGPKVEK